MEHWLERLTVLLHRANSDDFLPIFHNPKIDATNDSLQNNQKCEIKVFLLGKMIQSSYSLYTIWQSNSKESKEKLKY